MLNRKNMRATGLVAGPASGGKRGVLARRRFVLPSAKRNNRPGLEAGATTNGHLKGESKVNPKMLPDPSPAAPGTNAPGNPLDLTETIKTLLHIAQEHGYVTYDETNDVLPDGLDPDDLDELFTKLRSLDVEIIDQAEAERTKQPEPEEPDDSRLEVLDDPVRMYMNQMGKVPLLTREQEVEICKRIEEAELEMKLLIYSLGFTAKEHIAIAEKLLSEPPKERFDRVVVDKKIANREGHLRDLRTLIKRIRTADQNVDEKYAAWQKALQKGRKEKLAREFKKLGARLQDTFPKFAYKQKVIEEMIVVAGNVHEKFQSSWRHIQELEHLRTSSFFQWSGDHQDLHSFPTRRSSG